MNLKRSVIKWGTFMKVCVSLVDSTSMNFAKQGFFHVPKIVLSRDPLVYPFKTSDTQRLSAICLWSLNILWNSIFYHGHNLVAANLV